MLISVEHNILNAHKYIKYQDIRHCIGSDQLIMIFFLFINVKMPTVVGVLTFIEQEKIHTQLS